MTSILCIGDFGTGKIGQYKVSNLLNFLIKKFNSKFILGLGDNIYPDGVSSVNDPEFFEKFEKPYLDLPEHIKFYNVLGNHDYHIKTSPLNQIKYTHISNRWVMPHNFYCFRKKFNKVPVEFIGIDTNIYKMKNRKLQEQWILNTIYESKARWIVVFGHHPWKSFGAHGNCDEELDELYNKINNIGKVDLILSGHDHDKQHILIPDKPNMIVCGVGAETRDTINFFNNKELKYFSPTLGCAMIDFYKTKMKISFYNTDKEKEYSFLVNKI